MSTIDPSTFEELKQMSGEDFINELIDAFLEDAPRMMREMEMAIADKNAESFRRNAHSFKSNASTFGATELAALARELERMGRENDLEIGGRLEELKQEYRRVAQDLEAMRT